MCVYVCIFYDDDEVGYVLLFYRWASFKQKPPNGIIILYTITIIIESSGGTFIFFFKFHWISFEKRTYHSEPKATCKSFTSLIVNDERYIVQINVLPYNHKIIFPSNSDWYNNWKSSDEEMCNI